MVNCGQERIKILDGTFKNRQGCSEGRPMVARHLQIRYPRLYFAPGAAVNKRIIIVDQCGRYDEILIVFFFSRTCCCFGLVLRGQRVQRPKNTWSLSACECKPNSAQRSPGTVVQMNECSLMWKKVRCEATKAQVASRR
jgi:hypothetical protein